jgi:hypothetical protein
MDPAFAAERVAEMLDHIRDVDVIPRDPRLFKPGVEHTARRPDERVALDVFPIARLLTDEHQVGVPCPFADDRLGGTLPQLARATAPDLVVQAIKRGGVATGAHSSEVPDP